MSSGEFTQAAQCFHRRWDLSECRSCGFKYECSDIVAGGQPALHLLNVVRGGYQSVFNDTGDDARSATRREADMIVPAVEMPCKADNLAFACERSRHAQRQMRR